MEWISKVVVVSFTPDFGNRRGALISLKYIYFEIYDALSVRATGKIWDYIVRTDDDKITKNSQPDGQCMR